MLCKEHFESQNNPRIKPEAVDPSEIIFICTVRKILGNGDAVACAFDRGHSGKHSFETNINPEINLRPKEMRLLIKKMGIDMLKELLTELKRATPEKHSFEDCIRYIDDFIERKKKEVFK